MCAAHYQPSPSDRAVKLMKYGLVKLCTIRMTLNTGTCSAIRTILKINQEKHSKPAVTKLVGSKNTQHFPQNSPLQLWNRQPVKAPPCPDQVWYSTCLTLFNEYSNDHSSLPGVVLIYRRIKFTLYLCTEYIKIGMCIFMGLAVYT